MTQRLQFIAKKFQSCRPRAGWRPNIQNAATQGDFAFPGHLGFRFVTLFFKPINQIQRIDFIATVQRACPLLKVTRRKGFLEQGGDAGNDDFGFRTSDLGLARQGDEGLKPIADGIGVRQFAFVGKNFPGHALAVAMIGSGAPIPVVSAVLGHVSSDTTQAYYLRFDVERLRCCALDVEDVLGQAGAGERGA